MRRGELKESAAVGEPVRAARNSETSQSLVDDIGLSKLSFVNSAWFVNSCLEKFQVTYWHSLMQEQE